MPAVVPPLSDSVLPSLDFRQIAEAVATRTSWRPWWYFAVLVSVLLTDLAVLGWRRSSVGRLVALGRSARVDLVVAALHWAGWSQFLMTVFSGGLVWSIQRWLPRFESAAPLASLPFWGQVTVVFVLTDFLHYWHHRISHQVAFLWEAHKFHHAATDFTVLTGNRIHAIEEILRHVVVAVPVSFLGATPAMYVSVRIALLGFDMLQHSMVPWTYGWFGRWVIYSPVGHRIHHSRNVEHWDCNYGDLLVIWDRLFGTWYGGERVNESVDVFDNWYNRRSIMIEYLACAVAAVGALMRSLRSGRWLTDYHRARRVIR